MRYYFKLVNNTESEIVVTTKLKGTEEKTINEIEINDTLSVFAFEFCYKDHGPLVAEHFYSIFSLEKEGKQNQIDLLTNRNWTEKIEFEGLGQCKGGEATYTIIIDKSFFN